MSETIYHKTYILKEEIAGGGFARVFRGIRADDQGEQDLAIKIGRENFDPDYAKSIREEARIIAQMNHPNIVKVQSIPRSKNVGIHFARIAEGENAPYFFVMEYLRGGTLDDYIEQVGKISVPEAAVIALEIARALDHVHRQGYYHNDLKLENIVFRERVEKGKPFTPVLIDFGIATRLRLQHTTGSIYIMSPERLAASRKSPELVDKDIDLVKVDVWGLGIVLYRLLAGKLPFSAYNRDRLTERILTTPAESLQILHESVSPEVDKLVLEGCLAKNPKDRLTILELGQELRRLGQDVVASSVPSPTKSLWRRLGRK